MGEMPRTITAALEALEAPVGRLVMTVKSAHIYETEREVMAAILLARA